MDVEHLGGENKLEWCEYCSRIPHYCLDCFRETATEVKIKENCARARNENWKPNKEMLEEIEKRYEEEPQEDSFEQCPAMPEGYGHTFKEGDPTETCVKCYKSFGRNNEKKLLLLIKRNSDNIEKLDSRQEDYYTKEGVDKKIEEEHGVMIRGTLTPSEIENRIFASTKNAAMEAFAMLEKKWLQGREEEKEWRKALLDYLALPNMGHRGEHITIDRLAMELNDLRSK